MNSDGRAGSRWQSLVVEVAFQAWPIRWRRSRSRFAFQEIWLCVGSAPQPQQGLDHCLAFRQRRAQLAAVAIPGSDDVLERNGLAGELGTDRPTQKRIAKVDTQLSQIARVAADDG